MLRSLELFQLSASGVKDQILGVSIYRFTVVAVYSKLQHGARYCVFFDIRDLEKTMRWGGGGGGGAVHKRIFFFWGGDAVRGVEGGLYTKGYCFVLGGGWW